MKEWKYEHIKANIHRLDIDYENGLVLNRKKRIDNLGYVIFTLNFKNVRGHQIIAFLKYGDECIGMHINHINGNKADNRPSNLELNTPSENRLHAYASGLQKSGEKHHYAKLTEKDVIEIFSLLDKGEYQSTIAKKYNVHQTTISLIKVGKNWGHLKLDKAR